ncbi:hypothetical protein BJ742DRAFT_807548 [Cladochytrium replicatum]|nr:hypothetical protein BJ742DRAFT_807548 [Cladochytrium replicatum]
MSIASYQFCLWPNDRANQHHHRFLALTRPNYHYPSLSQTTTSLAVTAFTLPPELFPNRSRFASPFLESFRIRNSSTRRSRMRNRSSRIRFCAISRSPAAMSARNICLLMRLERIEQRRAQSCGRGGARPGQRGYRTSSNASMRTLGKSPPSLRVHLKNKIIRIVSLAFTFIPYSSFARSVLLFFLSETHYPRGTILWMGKVGRALTLVGLVEKDKVR